MNSEPSTVRAIVREINQADALVEIEQGGCGRCHEPGGCGGQQLTQMFCSTPKTYRVANEIGAGVGDRVTGRGGRKAQDTTAGDGERAGEGKIGCQLVARRVEAVRPQIALHGGHRDGDQQAQQAEDDHELDERESLVVASPEHVCLRCSGTAYNCDNRLQQRACRPPGTPTCCLVSV